MTKAPTPTEKSKGQSKNRSTEGCSKLKSQETRQLQETLISTLEHLQIPKWDRTMCPEDNTNNATKKFDYRVVADKLRTVSWSNYGHPTGVVNLVYGLNLPTRRNSRLIKRTHV